ncbi:hypothetical protein OHB01_09645 [Microbispora hainanensis]|jgi:hypothetical protein|uniref:Uncharacterized protein n=1 Tax=Microbispora hainanensis TaxID=568844 RepID=A0ABZ1SLU5_9ACTN|nr:MULTISPECIES: hypothetical protein [Microbispora]NJP27133.1 hypothetical protein [Microbispora sp. CL1-1]TQS11477.1 hypothetical protein FLW53_23620 [Microbispora sp. SCL1-1]
MIQHPADEPYEELEALLRDEFAEVHPPATVTRCVQAAHHGAIEVTGQAHPALVERIARKHLRVLATAAAERG